MRAQGDELKIVQTKLREAQTAASDAQFQLMPAQYDLVRVSRERDLCKAQAAEAEAELAGRLQELMDLRREHSNKLFELETRTLSLQTEVDDATAKARSLQVSVPSLSNA